MALVSIIVHTFYIKIETYQLVLQRVQIYCSLENVLLYQKP